MALLDTNSSPSIAPIDDASTIDTSEPSSDYSVGVKPMYSDAAYGLDTHAAQAGESSVFSTLGNLVTKGGLLTGLSVINSFANTAIDVTNWMGADNQRLSMENELGDGDTLDYYKAHSQGIETLGLIAGSFIPGTAALKALKLARLGAPTNILVRATNIFAGPKAALVEDALQTVNAGNKALFGSLNASKYQAIALGYGENFVQSLVFEAATAATMKASPILDGDSFKDTLDNMFFGALTGAGIGGTLEGAFTRGMFNKLLVSADITSKASELTTRLGKGNFLAGDKAYLLIDSMDKIPQGPGESVLSASKASRTIDSATLAFKKTVQDLVTGEGNEEVANAFSDIILKMRNEQGLNREEIYNQLARLKLVSRIDSDTSGVENTGRFYINRIANAEKDSADYSDILTPTPRYNLSTDAKEWLAPTDQAGIKASGYSQAFELKPGATRYNVSRSIDTFDPEGNLIPANKTASEAWASGYDIHVDAGNKKVYVNPKAPNIRQVAREGESRPLSIKEEQAYRTTGQLPKGARALNGADVILDTKTGAIKNWASPVIGDLGEVKVKANGVSYGENFSSQSLDAPITAKTSALDSNARYSWISNRGIAAGDSINKSDTAVLEQLYREGASNKDGWLKYLQKKGIDNYADGTPLPTTLEGMLQDVKNSKDSLVADLLTDNPKISSEEISRRANVSEDYLANNLQSLDPKELMLDPEANNSVRHVKLSYDIGNIYQQDGQIQRGLMDVQYRVQIIQDAQQGTAAKYFGPEAGKFLATMKASDADISGSGAGFLSFAQGKYNSLSQQMERIGREVTSWYRKQEGKISDVFSPHTNALREDPVLAAEASNFIAVRQRTGENYVFLPDALAQKYGMVSSSGNNTFAVLEKSLVRDKGGNILDWNKAYLPDNFVHGDLVASGLAKDLGQTGNSTYYQLSDKLAAFERANMQLNNANVVARNNLNAAWGLSKRLPQDILYTPPVNVSQAKHFAYVKLREGTGMGDDAVRVITAKSKQDLETLIASIHEGDPDKFSVYTKEDLKQHHEVLGDYEYSRNFANTQVDAMLTRKGILNDIYPTTRGDQIAQNYVDWHLRQAMLLTRDHVELGNGQLFAELKAMGERFSSTEASQAGFVSAALGRSFDNPYAAYVKTALAIGAKDNYRIWSETQERLESFFNTAFNTAKRAFIDAKNGVLPYEEAATMAEKFGLGNPYGTAINSLKQAEQNYYGIANKLPDSRFLSKFVSTSNTILGATVIKLDTWQQIIHMLSTPILVASEANSVRQMLTTELPDGSGKMIPATSKVLFQSVRDFFGPKAEFEARLKLYQDNNFMHDADTVRDMRQLQDALTLPMGNFSQSKAMANLGKAEAFAQKFLTITNFSEQFTAWMAARSAHQMFEAAGYSGQQLLDQIGSFVNQG
jgi:hypothetical protein